MNKKLPRNLKKRYQYFFREHVGYLHTRNATGKWTAEEYEHYHQNILRMDGMARFLALTPEERAYLEQTATQP